jgi:outer membrane lipoprotein-sorting protein
MKYALLLRTSLTAAITLCSTLQAHAMGWDIDQLMLLLAKAKPNRASFIEKKYISMLDRPVESSGELSYTPPDRLEKRTIKPKPEIMIVEGDTLKLERGHQKYTLQLQDYPELGGFIDSLRGTLAGDRAVLEQAFQLKLDGSNDQWTLTLLPKESKVATAVKQVKISGKQENVRSIEILQANGDHSVMIIAPLNSQ